MLLPPEFCEIMSVFSDKFTKKNLPSSIVIGIWLGIDSRQAHDLVGIAYAGLKPNKEMG